MKCPLLTDKKVVLSGEPVHVTYDCLQEECAWWSSEADACAAMIIAGSLAGMVAIGDKLLDELPREFTPRST